MTNTRSPSSTRPTDSIAYRSSDRGIGSQLATEWGHLRTRPDALRKARNWHLVDGPLENLDQILTAVGFEIERSKAADDALLKLVLLAATDDLAGRVVIQRLLPGLYSVVGRRCGQGQNLLADLLGSVWITIRTYNPERRPGCLAAALIADSDYRAFRAARRRRSCGEIPAERIEDTPCVEDNRGACEELADVLRAAREAGISDSDLNLLRQLANSPTAIELAAQLQVTPRTIRNRRDRITEQIRTVLAVA